MKIPIYLHWNLNEIEIRKWTRVLPKGTLFLLHMIVYLVVKCDEYEKWEILL